MNVDVECFVKRSRTRRVGSWHRILTTCSRSFNSLQPSTITIGFIDPGISNVTSPISVYRAVVTWDSMNGNAMNRIQPSGQARRARQNPVSCQLCRRKKLKCDRQQPCSNCSARGVSCQSATRHPTPATSESRRAPPAAETAQFQARLEKLEAAVFGNHDSRPSASTSSVPPPHEPPDPAFMPDSNANREHEMASKWLEGIGTLENSIVSLL